MKLEARNAIQAPMSMAGTPSHEPAPLLPGSALTGSWRQEQELGLKPRCSAVGAAILHVGYKPTLGVFKMSTQYDQTLARWQVTVERRGRSGTVQGERVKPFPSVTLGPAVWAGIFTQLHSTIGM